MQEPLTSFLHARAAEAEGQDCLDVIHTGPAVWARIKQVAAATRSEYLSLEPRRQGLMPDQEHREGELLDRGLARRGVRHLCVISDQLGARRDVPLIQELAAAGSPSRYSPSLPLRVLVYDRRVAFFALAAHDTRRGAWQQSCSAR